MNMTSNKQAGLSLIELMIAIALGIFITGGLISLFINSNQTYRVQENLSRMQENARFAMGFLSRDIRVADYSGCNNQSINNAQNHLDITAANQALYGFSAGIDGVNGAVNANTALDNPDEITISSASDTGLFLQPPFGPLPSDNINIAAGNGLQKGDIIAISDCEKTDIFQISNDPSGGAIAHSLNPVSPPIVPGNKNLASCSTAGAHCLSKVYQGEAGIIRISTLKYEIKTSTSGVGLSLFRNNNDEIAEGIDNMQILYGQDTDNDGAANYYVPAGTAGLNMDEVVSVRISLLVVSLDDNLATQAQQYTYNSGTVTPADRRLRQVFTSTISLRNRIP
jgi:type IV pilus assembly protein PilW